MSTPANVSHPEHATETVSPLSNRLMVARNLRHLSQTELADLSGVPQYQISRIENGGVAEPSFTLILKLTQALNISLDALAAPSADPLIQELATSGPGEATPVLIGTSPLNNRPVAARRFNVPGEHLAVIGDNGSGRSYAAKLEALRANMAGLDVSVIDTYSDYVPFVQNCGGTANDLASGNRINLLDVALSGPQATVREHCAFAADLLLTLAQEPHFSPLDQTVLIEALVRVYDDYGYLPDTRPVAGAVMPLLGDLPRNLQQLAVDAAGSPPADRALALASALQLFIGDGALASLFDGPTRMKAQQSFNVLDLGSIPFHAPVRQVLMLMACRYSLHAPTTRAGTHLVVFELHDEFKEHPLLLNQFNSMVRGAKEAGASLTIVLTSLELGREGTREVLELCSSHLVLRISTSQATDLRALTQVSAEESATLANTPSGRGLLIRAGHGQELPTRGWVTILGAASPEEHELITTRT